MVSLFLLYNVTPFYYDIMYLIFIFYEIQWIYLMFINIKHIIKIYWKWAVEFLEYSKNISLKVTFELKIKICWEKLDNFKWIVEFKTLYGLETLLNKLKVVLIDQEEV